MPTYRWGIATPPRSNEPLPNGEGMNFRSAPQIQFTTPSMRMNRPTVTITVAITERCCTGRMSATWSTSPEHERDRQRREERLPVRQPPLDELVRDVRRRHRQLALGEVDDVASRGRRERARARGSRRRRRCASPCHRQPGEDRARRASRPAGRSRRRRGAPRPRRPGQATMPRARSRRSLRLCARHPSVPEVAAADGIVGLELFARAGERDASRLEHVAGVRRLQREVRVLLDDEDGEAIVLVQSAGRCGRSRRREPARGRATARRAAAAAAGA